MMRNKALRTAYASMRFRNFNETEDHRKHSSVSEPQEILHYQE